MEEPLWNRRHARESRSLDRLSRRSESPPSKDMPSSRAQSMEKLDGVSLPYGSEKVVSVKRKSKHGTGKTQPLTINTGDSRLISTSEGDLTMRKIIRREKKRYSGLYEDPKTHRVSLFNTHRRHTESRKPHVLSSVILEPNSDRRRVISCLELDAPEPADLETIQIERMRNGEVNGPASVPVIGEGRVNQGMFVFPREPSKAKHSREREIHIPVHTEDEGRYGMRYSGIFVPETPKYRSSSRHHSRKSRGSTMYASPSAPLWSPFVPVAMNFCPNCMASTCQRCRHSMVSPRKSLSQDVIGGNVYPYETVDMRSSPYVEMPQPVVTPYPSTHHHHHQYHQQRQRMSNYHSASRISDIDRVHHIPSRPNLLNTSIEELSGYGIENDRMVDLLEIEYASAPDESNETHLSPKDLNLIYNLARDATGSTDDLESMARHLKLTMDQQLGEKWHVVVGTDSFGSNLASLPGALTNFKVDKYVFLMWRT